MTRPTDSERGRRPTLAAALGLLAALLVLSLPSPRAPRRSSTGRTRTRTSAAPTSTARRRPEFIRLSERSPGHRGRRRPPLLGDRRWRHDRPRQPRRHRRRPELHHTGADSWGLAVTPATSTGPNAGSPPRDSGAGIGRANLDGSGVDQSFITGFAPAATAVWRSTPTTSTGPRPSDFPNGTIGRANLDGTGVDQSFITGATAACGIAVDARHVYWTNQHATGDDRPRQARRHRRRPELHQPASGVTIRVAVDAEHVYWAAGLRADAGASSSTAHRPRQPRRHGRGSDLDPARDFPRPLAVDGLADTARGRGQRREDPEAKRQEDRRQGQGQGQGTADRQGHRQDQGESHLQAAGRSRSR